MTHHTQDRHSSSSSSSGDEVSSGGTFRQVNVSGGPVAYNYPVHRISLHFGMDGASGSEHTVAGRNFVGEVRGMHQLNARHDLI